MNQNVTESNAYIWTHLTAAIGSFEMKLTLPDHMLKALDREMTWRRAQRGYVESTGDGNGPCSRRRTIKHSLGLSPTRPSVLVLSPGSDPTFLQQTFY